MRNRSKKILYLCVIIGIMIVISSFGCAKDETDLPVTKETDLPVTVETFPGEMLMYLTVSSGEASSFDQTPDWAPEPDPMAPVDGDMLTRWSSSYEPGEQWISFDLGGSKVVSNMIIRWERAYAVDYKILVSDDGKNWSEAYYQKDAKGGSVEAYFAPVECRYVKVLSTKRVNDSWGISIWEIEIYGPASRNPHSTIAKDQYLSKSDEEAKRKEADEIISKLSSPVVPIKKDPFQKGIVYTSWMTDEFSLPASDLTLAYLKEIGVDTVSIMVPAYQETLESEEIYINDTDEGDTPSEEALKHAIETCHKLGMRVMIKPHVDPRTDEARVNILASEKWFDSYEKFILKYAKFSQENNVELFAIGTELETTTFSTWTHRWEALIDEVRSVYSGALTYAANWTEYEGVPFWDKMDFIGIDAYFPLTNDDNAALQDLINSWNAIADKIEEWLKNRGLTDKGVLLTEIGYPSANGANRQPWVAISKVEDQEEQADCLEAVFEVLNSRSWFKGYYIWQYFPQKRWSPLGFTVTGKKAEEVIKKWLK